ncbi:cytochrome P450 [Mycobacterium palustre]|nr:cytochrome P450 [Mycobacterium palustre]
MLLAPGKIAVSDAGVYFLSAADVVEQAATNPGLFSSQGAFDLVGSPYPMVPIAVDPPEHTRFRRVLDKFFGPRRMAERAPELRQQVGELIDQIKASGDSCEVMSALAVPFPSQVFLTLFGLPIDDRDLLIGWKDAVLDFSAAKGSAASPETLARSGELVRYLTEHLADRRDSDGDDLLSQLLADSSDGALTDEEIIGLCFLFLVAGLDTVTAATGFALYELARSAALRARVIESEEAVAHFIEEVLRINPPIPYAPRVTTAEVNVAGVTIPAGSTCWLGFGTANRDPDRYPDADVIHQRRNNHFAFGRGPHRCLGSHLARLELRLIVEEWNRRIPSYSVMHEPAVGWPCGTLHFRELHLQLG